MNKERQWTRVRRQGWIQAVTLERGNVVVEVHYTIEGPKRVTHETLYLTIPLGNLLSTVKHVRKNVLTGLAQQWRDLKRALEDG